MKKKKRLTSCLGAALCLLLCCGRAQASSLPVHELTFALDGITDITLSYDEENVTFYESEDGRLVVRESMTVYKPGYGAKVEQRGGSLSIREGGKPLLHGDFLRAVDVFLPASFQGNLTVTTTDGAIDLSRVALSLDTLRADSTAGVISLGSAKAQSIHLSSTSGSLRLESLHADTIRLETTRADLLCETLRGHVVYTTTSGSATIRSACGSGSYRAENSGALHVTYAEVTGDLSFYNKNGEICIGLPPDLSFTFTAVTKNGSVHAALPVPLSLDGDTTSATIGDHPTAAVHAETKNGRIEVSQ